MNILDPRFKYTPSISTDVSSTWTKFGFKPTSDAERIARQGKRAECGTTRAPHTQHSQAADFPVRIYERASGAH